MFFLKKLISRLFFPVPLVLELLIFGLILQYFSKWKRTGKGFVLAGVVLLMVFGYNIGTEPVLRSIERRYPPVTEEVLSGLPASTDILVLGQGLAAEPGLPANSRVGEVYLARILEAVRVQRLKPGSRILVSVPGYVPREDKRDFLDGMADIVGLKRDVFVLLDGARDTADELSLAMTELRGNKLVVVSSASHLPRAMMMFADAGVDAVPAPCAYNVLTPGEGPWSPVSLFPSAGNLLAAENAVYEMMGNVWFSLKRSFTTENTESKEDEI